MGTSGSSPGPGGGVPLIPRWVPPIPAPAPPGTPPEAVPAPGGPPQSPHQPIQTPAVPVPPPLLPGQPVPPVNLAPQRRFGGTRLSLGGFARTGSREDLRRGLGRYVRDGLTGSASGARRMGATARTAGALYDTLSALQAGQATAADLGVEPATLAGRPAREVMDVVVEKIRPIDGTQDAEANRQAIALATSDLLDQFPDADLTSLTADQIDLLIERYVANDLCQRVELDVGSQIETRAPDPATAVQRLEDMKQFVVAEVHATFRGQRNSGQRLQRGRVAAVIGSILREILRVFEEYLE